MKALIYTRRGQLPAAIAQVISTVNPENKIASKDTAILALTDEIRSFDPTVILIDGHFDATDSERVTALNGSNDSDIRLAFLQGKIPGSVKLLKKLKTAVANAGSTAKIIFFIDNPKEVLKQEISNAGAMIVYRSLDKQSETELALFEAAQTTTKALKAAGRLGKAIGGKIKKFANELADSTK